MPNNKILTLLTVNKSLQSYFVQRRGTTHFFPHNPIGSSSRTVHAAARLHIIPMQDPPIPPSSSIQHHRTATTTQAAAARHHHQQQQQLFVVQRAPIYMNFSMEKMDV